MKKLLLVLFALQFGVSILHAQFTTSSFATRLDFTSGSGTNSVGRSSSADFNGDGKIDAICSNISNNSVSIFKNTSTGAGSISFATKIDITTYSGAPENIAVADFDNDGKIDFALAHGSSTSTFVEVFRNTSTLSTISFASGVTFTVGTCPKGIVARDFDNDGKVDIATSNYSSGTISILRNTTTGSTISFATKIDYSSGASPILIISNDFDGDGKLDLALSNYVTSGYITIFRNTTSTSLAFTYWGTLTAGSLPNSLHSSDIDGDGKPELYVVNYYNYNFQVYRNTGSSGTISFATGVSFTTGSSSTYPQGIIATDFDGDGKRDIVTTNSGGSTISIFKNTATSGTISSSSFASAVNFSTVSANLIGLDTADYDNDGKPDITVSNNTTSTFSVLRNQIIAIAHHYRWRFSEF